MPDRVERLREAAQARHEATLRRAENTLRRLIRRGAPVTARQLAAEASVSRSWLYRQPELRQQLDRLRALPTPSGRALPAEQRASTESLQQQIHTYRQEITRLRAENTALNEQLARHLGAARATQAANPGKTS